MEEYIHKQRLLEKVRYHQDNIFGAPLIAAEIEKAETIVINYGQWILHYDELSPAHSTIECSVCHAEERMSMRGRKYCPNCGSIMDGGKM